MRVVVLGGAGFIGSAVCRMLVAERGATVLNIDRLTATSSLASLAAIAQSPRYSFRRIDICEVERVTALLHAFAPDAIVHAAAENHACLGINGAADAIETNVLGTWRVLEAARDYWSGLALERQERFRFLSVSRLDSKPSAATASRAAGDELVTAWHKSYGLPTIVSRAVSTFGPFQFPNEAVPASVIAAIDGVTADVAQPEAGSWLFVEDHVRVLMALLDKGTPGASYAVQGRGNVEPKSIAERVARLVERHRSGRTLHAVSADERMIRVVEAPIEAAAPVEAAGAARLAQDTGWRATETMDSGLSRTVRWYLANEAWWRPLVAAQAATEDFGLLRRA